MVINVTIEIKKEVNNMSILGNEKNYLKYFEEITKIPHGSYNEKALSEYLIDFAKAHNLQYKTDDVYNVIIYKPASKGYEDHETIALQSHIDMVDEKNSDSMHDFSKDPLDIYVEDGFIKAKGTTLGADDGAGVAMILSVLDDDTLNHPAIEAIFTTQEETTMEGAFKLKYEDIRARRMINLDGEEEGISSTTSAGGIDVIMTKKLQYETNSDKAYKLHIFGLNGGHSGVEINKERGNALKLISRIAKKLDEITLVDINGGLKINAIPREAYIIFTTTLSDDELRARLEEVVKNIRIELEHTDGRLEYQLDEVEVKEKIVKNESDAIIDLIYLMPTGLRHKSDLLNGLTTASENIGIVSVDNHIFKLEISMRGALESYIRDMANELFTLGKVMGFETRDDNWYPAWDYMEHSHVRDMMCEAYKEATGKDMVLEGIHAGLECGIFKNKFPEMDIVAIGPNILDCHSPSERIEIASFDRSYEFLKVLLSKL